MMIREKLNPLHCKSFSSTGLIKGRECLGMCANKVHKGIGASIRV